MLIRFKLYLVFFYGIIKWFYCLKTSNFDNFVNNVTRSSISPFIRIPNINPNEIIFMIKKISKKIFIDNCLVESVVAFLFFKSCGMNPKICIGVRKIDQEFNSHSWIELNNEIYFEKKSIHSYKKIYEINS